MFLMRLNKKWANFIVVVPYKFHVPFMVGCKNLFPKTWWNWCVFNCSSKKSLCRNGNLGGMSRWPGFKQIQNCQSCSMIIKSWFVWKVGREEYEASEIQWWMIWHLGGDYNHSNNMLQITDLTEDIISCV